MPGRLQYPEYFFEYGLLIWHQVQDAVTHDHIGKIRTGWHLLDISQPELHIVITQLFGVDPCLFNHDRGKVEADHLSGFPGFRSCHKTVVSGSTAEVDYRISLADLCKLGRQPASQRSEEHTSELQSLMRISYA